MWVFVIVAVVLASGCVGQGSPSMTTTTSTTLNEHYVAIPPAKAPSTTTHSGATQSTRTYASSSTTLQNPAKTFKDNGGSICVSDGRPIVRMYSKTTCEHCLWGKPLFRAAVSGFEGRIDARLWEFGPEDNLLTEEKESALPDGEWAYFISSNPSKSVPFFSVGCRFTRVGNGHYIRNEPDLEVQEFEALISYAIERAQGSPS